jgi:predicted RNase H-like nuclease
METNRTIQALLTSYSTDQLMVEDDLERAINDKNKPLNEKILEVKQLLQKITTIEQSVVKLQAMLQNNNNNNLKED